MGEAIVEACIQLTLFDSSRFFLAPNHTPCRRGFCVEGFSGGIGMEEEPVRPHRQLVLRELFSIRWAVMENFLSLQEPGLIVVDGCNPYSARLVFKREFELKKGELRMDQTHVNEF
jgi:hypothetical protein